MEYVIGMKLIFEYEDKSKSDELVEVVGLRKNGVAKLSNGWAVDEFGVAEGNSYIKGGRVLHFQNNYGEDK